MCRFSNYMVRVDGELGQGGETIFYEEMILGYLVGQKEYPPDVEG